MEELALKRNYIILSKPLLTQSFPTLIANATYYDPQQLEYIIELEMTRIKDTWSRSEEQYVEQSMLEDPITVERRSLNQQQQKEGESVSDGEEIDVVSVTTETKSDLKQQRADACRRSRHNNKIKKAKSKYRHRFMSLKLQTSMQLLNHILDVIDQAESHLYARGFARDSFQDLRKGFRMDVALHSVRSLEYSMKV